VGNLKNLGGFVVLRHLEKLKRLHWPLVFVLTTIAVIGTVLLYGAAGGSMDPHAGRHISRFVFGLVVAALMATFDPRFFYQLAYPLYIFALLLLVLVDIIGFTAMGATRWLDVGFIRIQPSELMKVGIVLALARFYHSRPPGAASTLVNMAVPVMLMAMPAALVMLQPDLGTAMLMIFIGTGLMFAAGVTWKFFALGIVSALAMLPVAWSLLHDYQRQRVLTFLDPDRDPLGAGYHVMQSKIAIGSSGFWGKGYMEGSQSHLLFLPEKHTDFIFTLMTEDFGMAGALVLIGLYVFLLLLCISISMRCRSQFLLLTVMGVTITFFVYSFINMSMVMGLLPVVGVPLPLVSFGGTSMLTLMVGMGLVLNAYVHRDLYMPGSPGIKSAR
jgi:rod shape determining protein RodA